MRQKSPSTPPSTIGRRLRLSREQLYLADSDSDPKPPPPGTIPTNTGRRDCRW